jgi:hypothetical protein
MEYETFETEINGIKKKHIGITYEDGSFRGFPADPDNPEYVAFLQALEEEKE